MSTKISDELGPAHRMEGESQEEYRERQRKERRKLKNYRRGDNIWPTAGKKARPILLSRIRRPKDPMNVQIANQIMQSGRGTYIKSKHGHIESKRRAS